MKGNTLEWDPSHVQALRAALRLTQEEFAERVAVDPRTVRNWQSGRNRPTLVLQRALDALFEGLTRAQQQRFQSAMARTAATDDPAAPPQGRSWALTFAHAAGQADPNDAKLEDDVERRTVLRLLAAGLAAPAFGLGRMPGSRPDAAPAGPSRVDDSSLEVIEANLASTRLLDDHFGSLAAARPALAQRQLVAGLLQKPHSGHIRSRLTAVAGEIAQLLGWLAFDMNDQATARAYFNEALRSAHEANDQSLGAYVLGYLSIVATYEGRMQDGLAFAQAAQPRAKDATSLTRSWIATVEAEALANLGDADGTRRVLDDAETALARPVSDPEPTWLYHYDRASFASAAGSCYLALGQTEAARTALDETLTSGDPKAVREQAPHLTRLAATYVPEGNIDEACRLGQQALGIAVTTHSSRGVRRVKALRARLADWADLPAVRELDDAVSTASLAISA